MTGTAPPSAPEDGASGEEGGPLPGTVCEQFIQCGKPNCRCRDGLPHGPYFYRIWRGDGRTVHKVYVKRADAERVRAQCDQYRVLEAELRALRTRRLGYTARLRAQIRHCARLRQRVDT